RNQTDMPNPLEESSPSEEAPPPKKSPSGEEERHPENPKRLPSCKSRPGKRLHPAGLPGVSEWWIWKPSACTSYRPWGPSEACCSTRQSICWGRGRQEPPRERPHWFANWRRKSVTKRRLNGFGKKRSARFPVRITAVSAQS